MIIFRGISGVKGRIRNPVLTIGNFDGVHEGHFKIFQKVVQRASEINGESVVCTFHPHPLKIVSPHLSPSLLTTFKKKMELIQSSGIDYLFCARFSKKFANQEPRTFAQDVLVNEIGVKEVMVGHDYKFGKGREGSIEYLKKMGDEFGFRVSVIDAVKKNGGVISSTSVRKLLEKGAVQEAAELLGRNYSIEGSIIKGRQVGSGIGYPTANLTTPSELIPDIGVYAVKVNLKGQRLNGVANVGYNPTFHRDKLCVEIHILDFGRQIYGQKIEVEFIRRIRDELEFKDVSELVSSIKKDIDFAKKVLENLT